MIGTVAVVHELIQMHSKAPIPIFRDVCLGRIKLVVPKIVHLRHPTDLRRAAAASLKEGAGRIEAGAGEAVNPIRVEKHYAPIICKRKLFERHFFPGL